jgi:phosphoadenosine phosphosulfate reductase
MESLNAPDMFGNVGKIDQAVSILKRFEPEDGYILAFSGGKDSVCIKALADMAGVRYQAVYNNTTVDPPELVRFVRSFPDVTISNPRQSMRDLIIKKGYPTRLRRFCCSELKEKSNPGKLTITGVRWAESTRRKNSQAVVNLFGRTKEERVLLNDDNDESRRIVEQCYRTRKVLINPIVNWTDDEVWEFIRSRGVRYCSLYDEGFTRLGCIGCPAAQTAQRLADFERWPRYKTYYLNAFRDWIKRARDRGNVIHEELNTPEKMFDSWLQIAPDDDGGLFEDY